MARISSPISALRAHYDVVVVGSGYGGGVAASRLARAGQKVCLFERGKEIPVGEFPDTLVKAGLDFQVDLPFERMGKETALYDVRVNEDMNVFVGCGLGGTSLVNANVSLQADPRVFDDPAWPEAIRDEAASAEDTSLATAYRRAEAMLRPALYPDSGPELDKLRAHAASGDALGTARTSTPINVTFETGPSPSGVMQQACNGCGDCVSGCNVGAKNTTAMNYLPDAVNHGAEIFVETSVTRIARAGDRWQVYLDCHALERDIFDAPELFVTADRVMLAAGTLGSTEILLRSREHGLSLSDRIGRGFTGNGDVLAFGYNCDREINGIGFGERDAEGRKPVGPCITSVIDMRATDDVQQGMVLEEGSLPGAVAEMLPGVMAAAARVTGIDTDVGVVDETSELGRVLESKLRGAYYGATRNTQTYLVMAHDDGHGEMRLEDDRLRVHWPDVGEQPVFRRVSQRLEEATEALGGTYVPNPIWNEITDHALITVHPLGGCAMADSAENGVVNDRCQVFSGASGADTHDGLYVCDGAVMPRSLGVNPLLTITALAERACMLICADNGWDDGYSETSTPAPAAERKTGIQFTETMRGSLALDPALDFAEGAAQGQEFSFTLTATTDDLDRLLEHDEHRAHLIGTVHAPQLSSRPLSALGGSFQLLVRDPDVVGQRRMVYEVPLHSVEGDACFLAGYKLIHDDKGFDLWPDTTTLYVTLHRGSDASGEVLGRGILEIQVSDFLRQMTTMRALNTDNLLESAAAIARFGRYFAGALAETHATAIAPDRVFDPDAPPRERRPLRTGEPTEVLSLTTDDGVAIRLTRYRGGDRGPVMLVHGLGVASNIYSLDTVETNMTEFLFEAGYDVWLLDFRASIFLPASERRFSADEVALYDYPAAVAAVRGHTGADAIQVVAHCVGGVTFCMAMLAGLEGVSRAVISQAATHYNAPALSMIKAGMHLPRLLDSLGIDSLTAYRDTRAGWLDRLYDQALRLYPQEFEEIGNSPVHRRITFMYGQLWELDQLNTATWDILHELFGVANIEIFDHLSRLLRVGHMVNRDGDEVYLPNVSRLAIPIRFIHGAENQTFLPESTERSMAWLAEHNGADLYDRRVIENYGHIDCIFGKNAARDVYPLILEHLNNE